MEKIDNDLSICNHLFRFKIVGNCEVWRDDN